MDLRVHASDATLKAFVGPRSNEERQNEEASDIEE